MSSTSNEIQTTINNVKYKQKNVITINANSSENYILQIFNALRATVISGIEVVYKLELSNCRLTISQFESLALLIWSTNGIKSLQIANNIHVNGLASKIFNSQLAEFFNANKSLVELDISMLFSLDDALKIIKNKNIKSLSISIYIENYAKEQTKLQEIISDYADNNKDKLIITFAGNIKDSQLSDFQISITPIAIKQNSQLEIMYNKDIKYINNRCLPRQETIIFSEIGNDENNKEDKEKFFQDFMKKYWVRYGRIHENKDLTTINITTINIGEIEYCIRQMLEEFFTSFKYSFDQIALNEKLINKQDVVDADFFTYTCNKNFKDKIRGILYADFYQIMHDYENKEHFLWKFEQEYCKQYKIMNVNVDINNFPFQDIIAYIHSEVELFFDKNQRVYSDYFLQKRILDKICTFDKQFFIFCSAGSFRSKVQENLKKNYNELINNQDKNTVNICIDDTHITQEQFRHAAKKRYLPTNNC